MIDSLHVITQDGLLNSHAKQAELALLGGAKIIQFRSKTFTKKEITYTASSILELTKKFNAKLILNDHWKIAIDLGLDGVHVGLTDTPISEIRKHSDFFIGGTANTIDDIILHYQSGADYVGLGPFRFTKTKQNLSPILGINGYHTITSECLKKEIKLPIIAIGGIQLQDIINLKVTGIKGVAIASEINKSADPVKATQSFLSELA